ncbi:MAG: hypothetical protein ACRDD1_16635, partial [Planctomycetia bacterium]
RYDLQRVALMAAAFGVCALGMAWYNVQITGRASVTPYGLYTERHTPSHSYGFYNKTRGHAARGPETLLEYDEWADNVSPREALTLSKKRLRGLAQWTIGIPAVVVLGLVVLLRVHRLGDPMSLILLGLFGLTAAYFPFAFPGLLGFGYLAEGIPWLCIVCGTGAALLHNDARRRGRPLVAWWWLGLVAVPMIENATRTLPTLFAPGSELMHMRLEAEEQAKYERRAVEQGPILVLVDGERKKNLHRTFVYNRPTLDGPVVRAWRPRDPDALQALLERFPDRAVHLMSPGADGAPDEWRLVRPPPAK